jgi:hypothetical protein
MSTSPTAGILRVAVVVAPGVKPDGEFGVD